MHLVKQERFATSFKCWFCMANKHVLVTRHAWTSELKMHVLFGTITLEDQQRFFGFPGASKHMECTTHLYVDGRSSKCC